jgi:capsular polysaccharide biosynthesis protein
LLTLLPVLLLVGGAVYIGVARDPEYTAKSRVNVGRADVPAFYLQQVTTGNAALAGSYARTISTAPVIRGAAREARIPATEARDALVATPLPSSTLIQVEAKWTSSAGAVALANAAGQSLINYVDRVNRTDESDRLLRRYRKAQAAVQRAQDRVASLFRAQPGQRRVPELRRAQLAVDARTLKASNLASRYRDASVASSNTSQLTLIAPAASAKSDQRQVLERLLIIGLVAGLVLGLALALTSANWHLLRALRDQ